MIGQHELDDPKSCYQLIITFTISLSNVTNSFILESPQFGRVSGCCYGYCGEFCDWWIKVSALNMIG